MIRSFRPFQAGLPLEDQLTASRLNQMQKAILERTPNQGFGTSLATNSSGFSYSAGRAEGSRAAVLPFTVQAAGDLQVRVTVGHVQFQTDSFIPKIDGTSLNDENTPTLTLEPEQFVYLKATATFENQATLVATDLVRTVIGNVVGLPTFEIVAGPSDLRGQQAGGFQNKSITYSALAARQANGTINQLAWGPYTAEAGYTVFTEYLFAETVSYNGAANLVLTPAPVTVYS